MTLLACFQPRPPLLPHSSLRGQLLRAVGALAGSDDVWGRLNAVEWLALAPNTSLDGLIYSTFEVWLQCAGVGGREC
jgi:hypothetical protein